MNYTKLHPTYGSTSNMKVARIYRQLFAMDSLKLLAKLVFQSGHFALKSALGFYLEPTWCNGLGTSLILWDCAKENDFGHFLIERPLSGLCWGCLVKFIIT